MPGPISQESRCRPGIPLDAAINPFGVGRARDEKCWTRHRREFNAARSASTAGAGSRPVAGVAKARRGIAIIGAYRRGRGNSPILAVGKPYNDPRGAELEKPHQ